MRDYDTEDTNTPIANMKKILIIEKGEEDYKYLFNKKMKTL